MHPYRCRRNHSGRGYPQGLPRRRRPRWSRQTPWGTLSIPTTPAGYEELVDWANGFGPLEGVGIEGTGSFGAGVTRFLQEAEGTKVLGFRPGANPSDVKAATKFALRSVARRHQRLSEEISELDEQLDRLVA